MGFNTYGNSSKTIGDSKVVWYKVDEILPCGRVSEGGEFAAGTPVWYNGTSFGLANSGETAEEVNYGYILNDVFPSEGETHATAAIVVAGMLYVDRLEAEVATKAKDINKYVPKVTLLKEAE